VKGKDRDRAESGRRDDASENPPPPAPTTRFAEEHLDLRTDIAGHCLN
jgi:hypothetical protein